MPQLSASQRWDPRQRKFEFDGGIFPNYNEQIGKLVTQRFKPQKPNFGNSPLGPMLLAAGVAVLVAPTLIDAGVGLVDGVGDGVGQVIDSGGDFFGDLFGGLFG